MSPINELMSILPYAYHKHTFCQNYVLNFLCFRIKNYYYSKELIVNYILYKSILTASAKPSKNSSILTNSCAPGVSFFFFFVFIATEHCPYIFLSTLSESVFEEKGSI